MTDDGGALAVGQPGRDDFLRAVRERDVVAAGHDQQFAVGQRSRFQPRCENAEVLLIAVEDDRDVGWRMRVDVVLDEVRRAVRGGVVRNDDLKRTVRLRECRLQCSVDPLPVVVEQKAESGERTFHAHYLLDRRRNGANATQANA